MKRTSTIANIQNIEGTLAYINQPISLVPGIYPDQVEPEDHLTRDEWKGCKSHYISVDAFSYCSPNLVVTLGYEYISEVELIYKPNKAVSMSVRRWSICKRFAVENSLPLDILLEKILR